MSPKGLRAHLLRPRPHIDRCALGFDVRGCRPRRMKLQAILSTLAFVLVALTACVAGYPDGAPYAPPAPLPEVESTPPAPGMVWVAGAWHWNGVDYVWAPGHWESPPPAP